MDIVSIKNDIQCKILQHHHLICLNISPKTDKEKYSIVILFNWESCPKKFIHIFFVSIDHLVNTLTKTLREPQIK